MTINYTTLLGLAKPVTGTETGDWGDVVNDEITSLLEDSVANSASFSVTAGNVTLTTTNGASNQARMSTLIVTGSPGTTRNVVAPSQAKIYTVINQSDGAVVIKGSATTGTTIGAGQNAVVAWNGSDFVEIGNYIHGNFVVNGNLTVNGNTTLGDAAGDAITVNGTATFTNVNPILSAGTANGVAYLNGSKVLTSGSALTFDGTDLVFQSAVKFINNDGSGNKALLTGYAYGGSGATGTLVLSSTYGNANQQKIKVGVGGAAATSFEIDSSEAMRLTSTGLGIGTSSPAAKLDVSGGMRAVSSTPSIPASGAGLEIYYASGTFTGTPSAYFISYDRTGSAYKPFNFDGSNYTFRTSGTASLTLDSSGNLGIGTSSPSSILHARKDQNNQTFFILQNNNAAANASSFTKYTDGTNNAYVGMFNGSSGGTGLNVPLSMSIQTDMAQLGIGTVNASGILTFYSGSAVERARIDSSGNLLVGTTSAYSGTAANITASTGLDIGLSSTASSKQLQFIRSGTGDAGFISAATSGFTNYCGILLSVDNTGGGTQAGSLRFYTTSSATSAERVRIDSSGNVGIGTSSPGANLEVTAAGTNGLIRIGQQQFKNSSGSFVSGTDGVAIFPFSDGILYTDNYDGGYAWRTGASVERMRLDSSGNFGVGTTPPDTLLSVLTSALSTGSQMVHVSRPGTADVFFIYAADAYSPNGAAATVKVGHQGSTGRSINAGGTINASGSDYAEYMTKAGDFVIAKGDICGVDSAGKLTNVFGDAVSFVVKSTNPSYVGGDGWGSDQAIGLLPPNDPVRVSETDEEFEVVMAKHLAEKEVFELTLETARQKVDRIAFAGQVPVNVTGATPGQYIVPVNDNGAIKGAAVSSPTFEQYQVAVGKVIAIEPDGRARVMVKVA